MNNKKWLSIFLVSSFLCLGLVGLVNYVVDPLWIFNHSNNFNKHQSGFNERMQKSSYVQYHKNILKNKDTLLLGASTSTYNNENKFPGYRVFNYSVSSGTPMEYEELTSFAESIKKEKFENIMLGLDFSIQFVQNKVPFDMRELNYNKVVFFLRKYVSFEMLQHSLINIELSLKNITGHRAYNRYNIALVDEVAESEVNRIVDLTSKHYLENKAVNSEYLVTLKDFKSKYRDRNFIVYTTPTASPFLNEIYSNKRLKIAYIQWIKEITELFGTVYFFTLPSEFSENYLSDSKDGIHFYPSIGEKIGEIIHSGQVSDDFGIVFTRENIDDGMVKLNKKISEFVNNQN